MPKVKLTLEIHSCPELCARLKIARRAKIITQTIFIIPRVFRVIYSTIYSDVERENAECRGVCLFILRTIHVYLFRDTVIVFFRDGEFSFTGLSRIAHESPRVFRLRFT